MCFFRVFRIREIFNGYLKNKKKKLNAREKYKTKWVFICICDKWWCSRCVLFSYINVSFFAKKTSCLFVVSNEVSISIEYSVLFLYSNHKNVQILSVCRKVCIKIVKKSLRSTAFIYELNGISRKTSANKREEERNFAWIE